MPTTTTSNIVIDPVEREAIWQRQARVSQISWGAVFAGLISALAINWLLNLFGVTIGVTVADAANEVGEGLGWATIIWIMAAMLVSYFAGGWIAARLSGKPDDTAGMLHGMTVWGLGTLVTLWMVSSGISSIVYSGYQALSAGTQAIGTVIQETGEAAANAGSGIAQAMPSMQQLQNMPVINTIAAEVKSRAVELAANSENPQGAQVSEQDIRQAIDKIDDTTMNDIAQRLASGKNDEVKQILSDRTDLEPAQIDSLMQGISQSIQERLGTANNNQDLAGDLRGIMRNQTAHVVAKFDSTGGVKVEPHKVERALEELDANEWQQISMHLLRGETEPVKNIVITSTSMTRAEVNELVDGTYESVKPRIDEVRKEVNEAAETASDYSRAVLWLLFVSSALALAVAMLGGKLGSDEAERLVVHHYRARSLTTSSNV